MKISWVEILIYTAILFLIASIPLRLIYGRQMLEWEYDLIKSWGINRAAYDFTKIIGLLSVGIYFVVRDRRKKKRENSGYYELPKSK